MSAQCCISYKNQSFDLQCNQMTGFYMKCNTGLKWANKHSLSKHGEDVKRRRFYVFLSDSNNIKPLFKYVSFKIVENVGIIAK